MSLSMLLGCPSSWFNSYSDSALQPCSPSALCGFGQSCWHWVPAIRIATISESFWGRVLLGPPGRRGVLVFGRGAAVWVPQSGHLLWWQMLFSCNQVCILSPFGLKKRYIMGCSATKGNSFPTEAELHHGPTTFSSWDLSMVVEVHPAARGFPPTRRTHERHLLALERFQAKVERAPHRLEQLVKRYRDVLDQDVDSVDVDEMVSMEF